MIAGGALDCLAVIRAPLEQYPPSVNQVALLAEAGLRLGVVDCYHPDFAPPAFRGRSTVERFQPCRHTQLHKEKVPALGVRLWRTLAFRRCVSRIVRQHKPRVVIAYDPNDMFAVGPLWKRLNRPRLVWHFHELFLPGEKLARTLTGRAVEFARRHAAVVDLVTFPDAGRAEVFAGVAGLKTRPVVVMNCPRRMVRVPEDHLTTKLAEHGLAGFSSVYFHGWIGPSRCLETVIQSMRWWPERTLFVMIGPISEAYRDSLLALARRVGCEGRVLFFGSVPYDEVFHLAAGAAVGCSLVADQDSLNWKYSAGAINKRFEYMAVGLPQVANAGPGMVEVIERPDCGLLVDSTLSEDVGRTMSRLLEDAGLRTRMSESGRSAHLSEFNYERQYAPVLNQILGWCGKGKAISNVP